MECQHANEITLDQAWGGLIGIAVMKGFSLLFALLFFSTISQNILANPAWQPIQAIVLKADLNPKSRKEKIQLTKKAIQMAGDCIQKNPKEVACYYYRAQATGLYYDAVIFGYQKGIRSMIVDWQKAVELDPEFDHGGPYRMLGELFNSLPKYFGTKDIRQDLNKAQDYLQKAIEIDSQYPTNQLDMAEVLFKTGKKEEAKQVLQTAQGLMDKWPQDPYFAGWKQTARDLGKKLAKK